MQSDQLRGRQDNEAAGEPNQAAAGPKAAARSPFYGLDFRDQLPVAGAPPAGRCDLSGRLASGGHGEAGAGENRTTDGQTMMHILKANIGTGVLAMPNASRHVGLWLGFLLVPVIGAVCVHCMNILIASHNKLCDRFNFESLDYDQVAALSLACGPRCTRRLAKRAQPFVTSFLLFTQLGFCCVYIMFVVENVQLAGLNLLGLDYSTTTYLLLVFPVIGLASCTSNLKHLARISTLANVLQLSGLALILFDLLQFHSYEAGEPPAGSVRVERLVSGHLLAGLPLFFATAVYAFEGIGVVLPVIKEMQRPARISGWNGVLNSSMALVALLYMAVGFFGYAKYGHSVQASITLNLPETSLNELVRLIFALAIGLSYSLQFYVPWTIVWPHIDEALFYAYRPRLARDKLQILDALSAANEWALDEHSIWQHSAASLRHQHHYQQQRVAFEALAAKRPEPGDQSHNSAASTLASSYAASSCQAARGRASLGAAPHYGTMRRPLRDRLADLAEASAMPEVQWRPPPSSMRGKRKLVRYTVILLAVSFTFVAAALIPRLDLFIALIGALASSCLAIIFPAIIQLCTFWHPEADEPAEEAGAPKPAGGARRPLAWRLFVCKNLLLVLFGILGLITGGWISIAQLAAAYLSVES